MITFFALADISMALADDTRPADGVAQRFSLQQLGAADEARHPCPPGTHRISAILL